MRFLPCTAIIVGVTLSGCVSPPQPMTPVEITRAVVVSQDVDKCVKKGHVTELSALAMYKNEAERRLALEPNQELTDGLRKTSREFRKDELTSLENCRSLELQAVNFKNQITDQQRQQELSRQSTDARRAERAESFTPRYANCISTAGMTNCVAY